MSIGNRLNLVIEYYNMTHNSFAKSLGMHNGSNIKRLITLNRSPQISTVKKISQAYPNLNMDWLRTGAGQMISNLPEPLSSNDDLTVTAKQIIAKLDHDNINYREMLSNKLKDDRDYYDNESNHVKNISNILEGFKTLEIKVETYSKAASNKVVDQMSKAIAKQNELLLEGYEKIISLENDLEDIKMFMATNFELDKMNKKKSKQINRLNPKD